jgi:hypothetical protein
MTPFFYSLKKKRILVFSLSVLCYLLLVVSFTRALPYPNLELSPSLFSPLLNLRRKKRRYIAERGFFSKRKDREVVPIAFGIEVFVICGLWKPTDPMLGGRGSTPSLRSRQRVQNKNLDKKELGKEGNPEGIFSR